MRSPCPRRPRTAARAAAQSGRNSIPSTGALCPPLRSASHRGWSEPRPGSIARRLSRPGPEVRLPRAVLFRSPYLELRPGREGIKQRGRPETTKRLVEQPVNLAVQGEKRAGLIIAEGRGLAPAPTVVTPRN